MKSWSWIVAGMLVLALVAGEAGAGPVKMKVLKNNVNLRAKPVPTAEVVGQVSPNDVLISKSMDSDWVEIVPPTNVDLCVLGDYVKDGVIQCSQKVNIRSGPGINFAIVGQLAAGEKVAVRSSSTEWVKIAPPECCSLWVSRSLVEVVADKPIKLEPAQAELLKAEPAKVEPAKSEAVNTVPENKPEDKVVAKPPAPKPVIERAAVPVGPRTNAVEIAAERAAMAVSASEKSGVSSNAPPDLDLIPSLGQGQWKQYDGTLRPRAFFARTPSRFRLVTYDTNGNSTTVCFVKGNNDQLSTLINRPMIISGREYWVKRQNYPVLVPDRIVLK